MAEEKVRRCDGKAGTCPRKGSSVATYKVEWSESYFQADLCKEHAQPILDFTVSFPAHFTVKLPAGAKRGFQIHTMDEIERLKGRKR